VGRGRQRLAGGPEPVTPGSSSPMSGGRGVMDPFPSDTLGLASTLPGS
jgi:hypothetical protein